jgi:hypothetical protein
VERRKGTIASLRRTPGLFIRIHPGFGAGALSVSSASHARSLLVQFVTRTDKFAALENEPLHGRRLAHSDEAIEPRSSRDCERRVSTGQTVYARRSRGRCKHPWARDSDDRGRFPSRELRNHQDGPALQPYCDPEPLRTVASSSATRSSVAHTDFHAELLVAARRPAIGDPLAHLTREADQNAVGGGAAVLIG